MDSPGDAGRPSLADGSHRRGSPGGGRPAAEGGRSTRRRADGPTATPGGGEEPGCQAAGSLCAICRETVRAEDGRRALGRLRARVAPSMPRGLDAACARSRLVSDLCGRRGGVPRPSACPHGHYVRCAWGCGIRCQHNLWRGLAGCAVCWLDDLSAPPGAEGEPIETTHWVGGAGWACLSTSAGRGGFDRAGPPVGDSHWRHSLLRRHRTWRRARHRRRGHHSRVCPHGPGSGWHGSPTAPGDGRTDRDRPLALASSPPSHASRTAADATGQPEKDQAALTLRLGAPRPITCSRTTRRRATSPAHVSDPPTSETYAPRAAPETGLQRCQTVRHALPRCSACGLRPLDLVWPQEVSHGIPAQVGRGMLGKARLKKKCLVLHNSVCTSSLASTCTQVLPSLSLLRTKLVVSTVTNSCGSHRSFHVLVCNPATPNLTFFTLILQQTFRSRGTKELQSNQA